MKTPCPVLSKKLIVNCIVQHVKTSIRKMDASVSVEDDFNAAADCVARIAATGEVPDAELLRLYGLYKQATEGPCVEKKPSFFDIKGRSKHFAWVALGDMSQQEAQSKYVELLSELKPNWNQAKAQSSQGVGPVFSSLEVMLEDDQQVRAFNVVCSNSSVQREKSDGAMVQTIQPKCAMYLTQCMQALNKIPALIRATQNGDAKEIQNLLDKGHDVDTRDSDDCTSLHWAADKGNVEIIRLLIQRGASLIAKDVDGMTPIEYAELSDQEEAKQLIKRASCQQ